MRRATLSSCALRLTTPVAAADRVHDERRSLFLEVHDGDDVGVGECATSGVPGIDPTCREVVDALDALIGGGGLEAATFDVVALLRPRAMPSAGAADRAAHALLEAACLDLALRRDGRSLGRALGARATSVGFAGVVGIGRPAESAARARELVAGGARRIRVKHAPGSGVVAIEAVLGAVEVPVVVDANAGMDPERDAGELAVMATLPIAWLEQPFAPADLAAHAGLARRGVRVGVDESVQSGDMVRAVARLGAAAVCCIKPTRVGGLAAAIAIRDIASTLGLETYVGGAFETGLGRAVLGALASSEALNPLVGDVVGPAAYLIEDPCGLAAPRDGRQPLHVEPGCGPHPAITSLVRLRQYGS